MDILEILDWADWIKVGEALRIGRELALNHVGSNAPTGAAYHKVFGDWLQKNKFDDMDKGERSRLFTILDNLPEVERWRDTLTMTERLKLNHPNAVLRKWQAATKPPKPKKQGTSTAEELALALEEIDRLNKEIVRLREHVKELEAARIAPAKLKRLAKPKATAGAL